MFSLHTTARRLSGIAGLTFTTAALGIISATRMIYGGGTHDRGHHAIIENALIAFLLGVMLCCQWASMVHQVWLRSRAADAAKS